MIIFFNSFFCSLVNFFEQSHIPLEVVFAWLVERQAFRAHKMEDRDGYYSANFPNRNIPVTPPGLEAIYSTCRRLYPQQPNPLQVTALVKYW